MGQVVALEAIRAQRAHRLRLAALHAARHPALRWSSGQDGRAHRRGETVTACGQEGPLTLAVSGAPLCPECYPGGRV